MTATTDRTNNLKLPNLSQRNLNCYQRLWRPRHLQFAVRLVSARHTPGTMMT